MPENPTPGTMPTCIEHGNKLVILDTKVEAMSAEMKELSSNVRDLIRFQTAIVAQLRAAAFTFAVVQPIVTAVLVWLIQQHLLAGR